MPEQVMRAGASTAEAKNRDNNHAVGETKHALRNQWSRPNFGLVQARYKIGELMGRDVASVEGNAGIGETRGRLPGRKLRRAWVQGGLFYILVVVPVVAGINHQGPLAPIFESRPNPNVITVFAKTKVPGASTVEFEHPVPPIEVRLGNLILLVSIPAQLVFVTLRWLLWDKISHD
jgi:hypothetical protein